MLLRVLCVLLPFTAAFTMSGMARIPSATMRAAPRIVMSGMQGRRQFVTAVSASSMLSAVSLPAFASDAPVLVLGASGGTGFECVKYLLQQKRPCIAATRTGQLEGVASSPLLTVTRGDVTSIESMAGLIQSKKLGGVIYAASASRQPDAKKQSNAKAVDQKGVVECAKLCIAAEVPRLVLVSSGGVSKPSSAVYIFLNLAANGIMDAKISGENELRRLYAQPGLAQKNVGYTVVRPGGLTKDPPLGVAAVELNQGDTKSGRIARSDVAAVCIESLASPAAFDTTFECYYGDTAKELDAVMASNAKGIATGTKEATDAMSGKERRADSWPKLFEGLEQDV